MKIMLKLQPGQEYREIIKKEPITVESLVDEFREEFLYDILLAKVNGKEEELTFTIDRDSTVELLDMRNHSANLVYQNSLTLIYLKAVRDVMGGVQVHINTSLNKGLYTEIISDEAVSEAQISAVEERMRELVAGDIPIVREVYDREDAVEIWERYNSFEKAELLRTAEDIKEAKFYNIDGYRNFFFGLMVPSTGYIKRFQLMKYGDGVLMRFPYYSKPDEMPPYIDDSKIYETLQEEKRWEMLMGVSYLPDLNSKIKKQEWKDLILLSEALHEKKIAEIADRITRENKRIILIAGPSSSGKTTFARRLCIQLRVNGLEPLYLGTDDYFVERCDSPLDEDGSPNYENLEALDIRLFNDNMNDLLAGKAVDLPEFDFITGTKRFGHRITSVASGQPIVIEGIHALNGKLTSEIDDESKFKIYISPFIQLNIDMHNRVPSTDARILRRITRDYQFRNYSAADTIRLWPKVRAGEDKNIFPFNGQADVMFNSALIYELAAMKKYLVPLLESIEPDCDEYAEAVRLLKFIRFFGDIEDEDVIPNNSIIREFIGGSVFVE